MIKAGEELLRLQAENQRLKEGIKQAREEIDSKYDDLANSFCEREQGRNEMIDEVLAILDKLIESEG